MEDDAAGGVELLGTDHSHGPDVTTAPSIRPPPALILLVTIVAGLGFLYLVYGTNDEPAIEPEPALRVPSTAPRGEDASPIAGSGEPGLLVAPTTSGLVVVSADDGRFKVIELANPPVRVADAGGSSVFVYGRDERVHVVETATGDSELFAGSISTFAPSATPGRIWTRSDEQPGQLIETDASTNLTNSIPWTELHFDDPRLRTDDDGSLHQVSSTAASRRLGPPYHVLDTTDSNVYAEVCDDRACRILRHSLSESVEGWEPIGPTPASTSDVSVSSDDRWLTTIDDVVVALYRTDVGGVRKVFTSSSKAVFAPDSRSLYVFHDDAVEVVDLVGSSTTRVTLPSLPDATGNWIALSPD